MSIHMGIAGPAKITTLMRYATLCGVGNSLSFLRKQASSVRRLALGFDPEEIAAPLEAHVAAQASPSIAQLHVFTFGGLEHTAAWLFERGSWSAAALVNHPAT
jgi:methylenetetrahydrofolate reductase (NADPH)